MEIRKLREVRRFADEKMVKAGVFATERMFYDLYCLKPGQAQKVHSHAGSDKVYLVMEGTPLVTLGDEERELVEGEAVLCPAGVAHGVRAGAGECVLLVVTTPPPQ
jgi:quercetin dioxygenase-like cupin family protein